MFDDLRQHAAARSILELVLADSGPDLDVFTNQTAQPLLCAYQLASFAALRPLLPGVRAFAGYSIGELAAYGCAGALTPLETIQLARLRALAMDQACDQPTGLISIRGLTRRRLEEALAGLDGGIAIINGPDRFVWGGLSDMVEIAAHRVAALGGSITTLPVGIASHTFLMRPAAVAFRAALEASHLAAPLTPVLSGRTGAAVFSREGAIVALSDQIDHSINWHACLTSLREMGCTVMLELGPGCALAQMARDLLPGIAARSLSEFRSINGAAAWVERQLALNPD